MIEVKSIFSAGQTNNKTFASVIDPRNANQISGCDPDEKLKDILDKAEQQYRLFLKNSNNYAGTPFVVAIVDHSHYLDDAPLRGKGDFFGLEDISAVLWKEGRSKKNLFINSNSGTSVGDQISKLLKK